MDVLVVISVLAFVGVGGWMAVHSFQTWKDMHQAQYLVFTVMVLAILLTTIASVLWAK